MTISKTAKQLKKKRRRLQSEKEEEQANKKRVKFDLEQNKSRGKFESLPHPEFFTYGKVAT